VPEETHRKKPTLTVAGGHGQPPDALRQYVLTLHDEREISELILKLEAVSNGDDQAAQDAGIRALATGARMDFADRSAARRAILALGDRAAALRTTQLLSTLPASVDDEGIAMSLVRVMDAARLAEPDPELLPGRVVAAADGALEVLKRNATPRSDAEVATWTALEETVRRRTVPGFARAAAGINALEDKPLQGALLRSPVLMAVLVALPGLLTIPMPISTPILLVVLALVGAFVVHPIYVRQVAAPLKALGRNLALETNALRRRYEEETPESSLEAVIADALPVLDGERRAGRADEDSLRKAMVEWLDGARLAESGRSARYVQQLRGFLEGTFVHDYARYARARDRFERALVTFVIDSPIRMAILTTIVTLPLSVLASRVTPLPPHVDFPLMVALLAAFGATLPRLLVGTQPFLQSAVRRLIAFQKELDSLP
jgi:hypothetical protein